LNKIGLRETEEGLGVEGRCGLSPWAHQKRGKGKKQKK